MPSLIDRIGHLYGQLTVLRRDTSTGPASHGKRTYWVCRCACGAEVSKKGHELACGATRSCGCLLRSQLSERSRKHGHSNWRKPSTPTYNSWRAAKARCHDPKAAGYERYGGRGIQMCERWRYSFANFLADMGERPAGTTIEREDVNGHYEPANCRWATDAEQRANKRPRK